MAESLPALRALLSVILPTPEQTCLLRACLHEGDAARHAWEAWQQHVGDPKGALQADRVGVKRLLPLLFHGLRRNGVVVDRSVLPYLRVAYLNEELRCAAYRRISGAVLSTLAAEQIPLVALKGAALTDTVYRDGALRHSHDLDLLLRTDDLRRAADLLAAQGLAPSTKHQHPTSRHLVLLHRSHLPVKLHTRPFRVGFHRAPLAAMWARSRPQEVAGVPARVLSPADTLLHVCGLAASSRSRESLQWVCDAWLLIAHYPDLDWNVLVDGVLRSRLALHLWVMLDYLATALQAPVPITVLNSLKSAASETDHSGRDAALFGARTGTRGTYKNLLRTTSNWRARTLLVKWMLFPSPRYLRRAEHLQSPWLLPLYYLYRPFRYVARRLSS